jgi:hypothetical protein
MGNLDGGRRISGRVDVVFGVDAMGCVLTAADKDPDGCELADWEWDGEKKRDRWWLVVSGMRKESRGRWHVNSDLRIDM